MADRRPGTKGATQLLNNSSLGDWQSMLLNYDDAVARVAAAKKKPELVSLDKWLWADFPQVVSRRSSPCCTKEELTRIMQWKLLRGKNRPALLNLIRQNSEDSVHSISQEAFGLLHNNSSSSSDSSTISWKAALSKLTELRGVGPATASAVLAPLVENIPFMADETLEAVTHQKRDYTLKAYESMHIALHELCRDSLGGRLSPEEAGKALWTAGMLSIHPPQKTTTANNLSNNKTESLVKSRKVARSRSASNACIEDDDSNNTVTKEVGAKKKSDAVIESSSVSSLTPHSTTNTSSSSSAEDLSTDRKGGKKINEREERLLKRARRGCL
jgi:hypothetical protein